MAKKACKDELSNIASKTFCIYCNYTAEAQSAPFDGKNSFRMVIYCSEALRSYVIRDKNKIAEEMVFPVPNVTVVVPNSAGSSRSTNLFLSISGVQSSIEVLAQRAHNYQVQIVFTNLHNTSSYLNNDWSADVLAIKIIDKRQRAAGVISQVVPDRDDAVAISEDQEAISPAPPRRSSGNTPVIKNEAVRRAVKQFGRQAIWQGLNSL